jgi:hypothetical protein
MRLTDLHPGFLQHPERGLMLVMRCPLCGNHGVGVPVTIGVKEEKRWMITSKEFVTLTMAPSVRAAWSDQIPEKDRCPYHFRIENGEIVNC